MPHGVRTSLAWCADVVGRRLAIVTIAALLLVQAGLAGPAAVRATELFTELRTFPGVVLLPSGELGPFAQLEPWRVELNRPRPGSTAIVHARYLVQYRQPRGGAGSAQVGGSMGRDDLDQVMMALAARSYTRCPADAPYCAENVAGQDGAPPASEVFRGLRVLDGDAVVEHVVCCGGHYWSLTWYDAPRNMTYNLVLVGSTADQLGSTIGQENVGTATMLTGLAERLTPLE